MFILPEDIKLKFTKVPISVACYCSEYENSWII